MYWGRERVLNFKAGKTQILSIDCSNNYADTDVKMDQYVRDKKLLFEIQIFSGTFFKIPGLSFTSICWIS